MIYYPSGYDGNDADLVVDVFLPLDDLIARHGPFHPEFDRRLRSALTAAGGLIGIGGGWRSSDLQRTVFLQRHTQVSSGGCCTLDSKRYALKPGMAHAAPPGSSFHETQVFADGRSGVAAVDIVGHQPSGPNSHTAANNWMRDNGPRFGLMTAHDWSVKEPWHVQMIELPRSVSTWKAEGRPNPSRWALPDEPPNPGGWKMRPVSKRALGRTLLRAREAVRVPIGMATKAIVRVTALDPTGPGWLSLDGGQTTVVDWGANAVGPNAVSGVAFVALDGGHITITAGPASCYVQVDVQGEE